MGSGGPECLEDRTVGHHGTPATWRIKMGADLRSKTVIAYRPAQLAWVWAGPRSLGNRDLGLQSA